MQSRDLVGSLVNANPRETMKIVVIIGLMIWQAVPTLLGIGVYYGTQRYQPRQLNLLLLASVFLTLPCVTLQLYWMNTVSLEAFLKYGWQINQTIWHLGEAGLYGQVAFCVLAMGFNYVVGLPSLVAAILAAIDLIPLNVHKQSISALQRGQQLDDKPEKSEAGIQQGLAQLNPHAESGTVLGISTLNCQPVILADQAVNQVVLVLGTTGGGKTITLRRLMDRAIHKKFPLIIVDGKPTDENVEWVQQLAKANHQPFYGFNCGDYQHYDPLANGGYTELKDKIICLKDEWENDYYRSIAEDYLQTTFEVILKANIPFDLSTIVKCLDFNELATLVRQSGNKALMERVKGLAEYERKDITGLQAHLNLLIHSELGEFLKKDASTFNLADVIAQNGIVYFALPALRFPSFSKVLGKLVVNDIKAVIDRYQGEKRIFTLFDEFSVFAGEQVLNLVNMGRGKGIHAIFGTQGLADLEKIDPTFKDQMMNCANTIICHRLNDQNSAESVSNWVGTKDIFTVTAQLNVNQTEGGLGSVRQNKEFIVHPDAIKQRLKTGEAYLISKVGEFHYEKIRVLM